jgi:hypothetical protein
MISILLFLVMAIIHHWPLHQLDIKNAFLHDELHEEVYMAQPLGFTITGGRNLVYRLCRSLWPEAVSLGLVWPLQLCTSTVWHD